MYLYSYIKLVFNMFVSPSSSTTPRLSVLRRISDLLDEGDKDGASRLAAQQNISFRNDADVARLIADEVEKEESSNTRGGDDTVGSDAAPMFIGRSIHRYRSQIDFLKFRVPPHMESPLITLFSESGVVSFTEIQKLDNQYIRADFDWVSDKERKIGFGTTAWYFLTKDQKRPFVLEIGISKKYSASKSQANLDNNNFSVVICAIDINTGESLFDVATSNLFDSVKKDGLYNFSTEAIVLKLQATQQFDLALFEQNQPLEDKAKASCFQDVRDKLFYLSTPSLIRFPGNEVFRQTIGNLDLRHDMELLISSGDLKKLLKSGSTPPGGILHDGTDILEVNNSVTAHHNPFRGASRQNH